MALLIIGGVALTGFEVPSQVVFGGEQRLAIHKLIGGTRVIDAMGRDDSAVKWCGIFSGSDAGARARMLDAMRVAGNPLSLSWDEFCYTVIIDSLSMEFRNPWWIPYDISCTVVSDQAQSLLDYAPDLSDVILADLTSAALYYNVSNSIAATSVSDALTQGNAGYAAATTTLAGTVQSINAAIQASQVNLASTNLATLVSASGTLAQLCAARGYVERSISNLNGAVT
jgi:hypothetical protein